jgi:excisionase family DNA binding protein
MPESVFVRQEDRLTIQQAAEYLGVTVPTMYRWRARRRGPRAMRTGRRGALVYPRAELERWAKEEALGYPDGSRKQSA